MDIHDGDFRTALERLRALDRERMYLSRAAAALQWDEETYLPPDGVEDRAEQLAVLEGLAHEKLVNPEAGRLLETLEQLPVSARMDAGTTAKAGAEKPDGLFPAADFVRIFRRDYNRAIRLPPDFVRESARAEGLSRAAWVQARKNNDFAAFAPHLEKMIDLARRKSLLWGWGGEGAGTVYDGFLDFHEAGLTAKDAAGVFGPLGERLSSLLKKIASRPVPDTSFLHKRYDTAKQDAFCREVLSAMGFDNRRGRLDLSAHPFTTTLGYNDVRITTRYKEDDPLSGLFSVIHEGGHALYETGIDPVLRSSCLAEGVSMGIHESQSRLWENVIGRSRPFWASWFPRFKEYFPSQLEGVTCDDFYRALNTSAPGLIRVDADEVSYSLHIILRFDLEQRLFDGTLTVNELPAAWNSAMKKYLGIDCPDDARGVLQDIHWAMGSFGYFPSYALGNLYGLQLWKQLTADTGEPGTDTGEPGTDTGEPGADMERRDYRAIRRWLAEKIHRYGRCVEPAALLKAAGCGELSAEPFLEYIEAKYSKLYGI